ncbi:threonine synthase [Candidatus Vidania fulgoroideorum]
MNYISSKNKKKKYDFYDVLTIGMPKDGGLFLPEKIPILKKKKIEKICLKYGFYKTVQYVVKKFSGIYYKKLKIKKISKKVFKKTNFVIKKNKKFLIINLNSGKTFSFKDIAISFLSELIKKIKKQKIITATSGDTGSSCAFYMKKSNINTFIFSPFKKISKFQECQMFSIKNLNIFNISLIGNFDDCQKIIKENILKMNFNTINSVNFIRIIIQSCYYLKYSIIIKKKTGKKVIFSIPTGNFGNAFSSFLAYKMYNYSIKKSFVCNNENKTTYNIIKKKKKKISNFKKTDCPSMDISYPSNIERFFFYFKKKKNNFFYSIYYKKKKRIKLIKKIFKKYKIILDTHTANAFLKKKFFYVIINTACFIKFLDKLKFIKKIKSKFMLKIKKIRKKNFSFFLKDKKKIINFIKKNDNINNK